LHKEEHEKIATESPHVPLLISTCPPGIVKAMRRQNNKGSSMTVILRDIPLNYNRSMLVDLLNQEGFKAKFNLVYVPFDARQRANLGHAFVNFAVSEDAERAQARGHRDRRVSQDSTALPQPAQCN